MRNARVIKVAREPVNDSRATFYVQILDADDTCTALELMDEEHIPRPTSRL